MEEVKKYLDSSKLSSIPKKELIDRGEFFETIGFNIYTRDLVEIACNKARLDIFNKFDQYSCIKNDKWYLDLKKEFLEAGGKEFGRMCRKHNQLINWGIDPELK